MSEENFFCRDTYRNAYFENFLGRTISSQEQIARVFLEIKTFKRFDPINLGYNTTLDESEQVKDLKALRNYMFFSSNPSYLYLIKLKAFEPVDVYIGISEDRSYLIVGGICDFSFEYKYLEEIKLKGISKIFGHPPKEDIANQRKKELELKSFYNNFELEFLRRVHLIQDIKDKVVNLKSALKPLFDDKKVDESCLDVVERILLY